MKTARAFSLIELLIVIAISAAVLAVVTPSFITAKVQADVARTHSDIMALRAAIEWYRLDTRTYPVKPPTASVSNGSQQVAPVLSLLTTPVHYTDGIPIDRFSKNELIYGPSASPVNRADSWVVLSVGPDEELTSMGIKNFPAGACLETYTPTNGAKSAGDIYSWGSVTIPDRLTIDGQLVK